MVLVIGLTGSIAAGKSTVGQILASRGAIHCDADKLVHGLYAPGTPGFDKVVGHFGQEVVGADGFVDRKVLGAKVFGLRHTTSPFAILTTPFANLTTPTSHSTHSHTLLI